MARMPDTSRQKIRKARVLIVEDQPILREKLVELISSHEIPLQQNTAAA
jgi:hypothetical protein